VVRAVWASISFEYFLAVYRLSVQVSHLKTTKSTSRREYFNDSLWFSSFKSDAIEVNRSHDLHSFPSYPDKPGSPEPQPVGAKKISDVGPLASPVWHIPQLQVSFGLHASESGSNRVHWLSSLDLPPHPTPLANSQFCLLMCLGKRAGVESNEI
jgi:hypothetical protein